MLSEKEQAAIKRLRLAAADKPVKAYKKDDESWVRDNAMIAKAYMRENKLDIKDKPITLKWLLSLGFVEQTIFCVKHDKYPLEVQQLGDSWQLFVAAICFIKSHRSDVLRALSLFERK